MAEDCYKDVSVAAAVVRTLLAEGLELRILEMLPAGEDPRGKWEIARRVDDPFAPDDFRRIEVNNGR